MGWYISKCTKRVGLLEILYIKCHIAIQKVRTAHILAKRRFYQVYKELEVEYDRNCLNRQSLRGNRGENRVSDIDVFVLTRFSDLSCANYTFLSWELAWGGYN